MNFTEPQALKGDTVQCSPPVGAELEAETAIVNCTANSGDETANCAFSVTEFVPPIIIIQPQGMDVARGVAAGLSVVAEGTPPLEYRWFRNGELDRNTGTNSTYTIHSVEESTEGFYSVTVINKYGNATSDTALVRTIPFRPPQIVLQPESVTMTAGETLKLRSNAWGTPPLSCRWYLDGKPLVDETKLYLTVKAAGESVAGSYYFVATNALGASTSAVAQVTVHPVCLVAWGTSATNVPSGLSAVTVVSAAASHSLVVHTDGTVTDWSDWKPNPVAPPAGLSNVVDIAAGSKPFGMALSEDGRVRVWGMPYPQILNVPERLTNVVAIAAEDTQCLALQSDGVVNSWGLRDDVQPAGLSNVVAVAASMYHRLALRSDGTVVAWGIGSSGQTNIPPGLRNVVAVAAGPSHSLALTVDGIVVAWGATNIGNAAPPDGLHDVVAIAAGGIGSLALRVDGTVVAWGLDRTISKLTPSLTNVVAIAAGTHHGLALFSQGPPFVPGLMARRVAGTKGTVFFQARAVGALPLSYQWQHEGVDIPGATNAVLMLQDVHADSAGIYTFTVKNALGVAGSRGTELIVLPVMIRRHPASQTCWRGGTVRLEVDAGEGEPLSYQWRFNGENIPGATNQTLMLENLGFEQTGGYSVLVSNAFGSSTSGEAWVEVSSVLVWGADSEASTSIPRGLSNVVAISTGSEHNLALRADGTVTAWGGNRYGQCDVPAGLSNVVAISAGVFHSLALTVDGTVVGWSRNDFGQLTPPEGLSNIVSLFGGGLHSSALLDGGGVVVWGRSADGPAKIPPTLSNVVSLSGCYRALALRSDGIVEAFKWVPGLSSGNPVVPAGISNIVAIAGGDKHSLALRADGRVLAWGENTLGQATVPVGLSDVISIAAGDNHSLALRADGTVALWGGGAYAATDFPAGLRNVLAIAASANHSLALIGSSIAVSPPHLAIQRSTSAPILLAYGDPGCSFQLLRAPSVSGPWLPAAPLTLTNSIQTISWRESPASSQFFRLLRR